MVGFIGPDGVGKSDFTALIAGVRRIQQGHIEVLGGNWIMPATVVRYAHTCLLPPSLGKNLYYLTYRYFENIDFFARYLVQQKAERERG